MGLSWFGRRWWIVTQKMIENGGEGEGDREEGEYHFVGRHEGLEKEMTVTTKVVKETRMVS